MNKKAIALLSGGLDSTLAICIVKAQGVEVEALKVYTVFSCCGNDARLVAQKLGVRFTMLRVGDDYLDLLRRPRFGYGRGLNPCVDCRAYMFGMARQFMETVGASFIISGEVLEQRPMSQKYKDFKAIEASTGLEGLILRPLSAKRLPVTKPEEAGIIDRSALFGICGRTRHKILELAAHYGIEDPPHPSSGCALTSPLFARKLRDVFDHQERCERWEIEILKTGRHFRLDPCSKAVLARDENESAYLEALRPEGTTLLRCFNFGGPSALLIGDRTPERLQKIMGLMVQGARKPCPEYFEIKVDSGEGEEVLTAGPSVDENPLITEPLRI
ncbi:MAG: 7-cyano-7-deazaguanine synthase [Candidatus Omnitrophica bacterium]|nr:7-cyano-7-deazaguanine synthase [Candidatus Omnitrophota bacterium]MDD5670490.1 7-cyano-7-deazaguanine synthase [Candidatus Omnitrophota bacterium]